jgi:hypothetical protein
MAAAPADLRSSLRKLGPKAVNRSIWPEPPASRFRGNKRSGRHPKRNMLNTDTAPACTAPATGTPK